MSYSINVRGVTKDEALQKLQAEFENVVQGQVVHQRDQHQAISAAAMFIDLLGDDDAKDVVVTVCGSLSWMAGNDQTDPAIELTGASVSIGAYLGIKEVAKTTPAPAPAPKADAPKANDAAQTMPSHSHPFSFNPQAAPMAATPAADPAAVQVAQAAQAEQAQVFGHTPPDAVDQPAV